MTKLIENVHFDSTQYAAKISHPTYSLQQLALNIYRKRRAIATSKVQIIGGVTMFLVTMGLSLFSSAIGLRTLDVEKQKLHLLEREWAVRGQYPLPKRHIQDTIIPVLITTSLGVLGFFLDFGAASAVFQQAMYHLGDAINVSGATAGLYQRLYESLMAPAWRYMGQTLGTKVMDAHDYHSGVHLPIGYYHNPQPGERDVNNFTHDVVSQRCSTLPIRLYDTFSERFVSRNEVRDTVKDLMLQRQTVPRSRSTGSSRPEGAVGDYLDAHEIKRLVLSYTKFAILSHVWGSNELSFQSILNGGQVLKDSAKFVGFIRAAVDYGCRYAWLDTACIDKSSSSELDESILSMFTWYRTAHVCFVYLDADSPESIPFDRWLTRGWTLQELLAPKRIVFFGRRWQRLFAPSNNDLEQPSANHHPGFDGVRKFTSRNFGELEPEMIDDEVHAESSDRVENFLFDERPLEYVGSWAGISFDDITAYEPSPANARRLFTYMIARKTTVPEDAAYCLLGLLGVSLTAAYGEGKERALYRLQRACVEESNERNIFFWDNELSQPSQFNSMLPRNPFTYKYHGELLPCYHNKVVSVTASELWNSRVGKYNPSDIDLSFSFTNAGLRIPVILHDIAPDGEVAGRCIVISITMPEYVHFNLPFKLAILGTYPRDHIESRVLAVILEKVGGEHTRQYRRVACGFHLDGLPSSDDLLSRVPETIYII
ncbi:hypothetical protein ONZ45_g13401 [Pleurotus djamor]|nr:hypothetical protein ONZ45_g13401 [Pleurotus djamor]